MLPHGIAGPPDQSSRNSGNKCPLARRVTVPNFVTLCQEQFYISAVENLCCRKWTKVHQNHLRPATHQCPSSCQISSRSAKWCARKTLQILHPSLFWRPRGIPWAKFTNLGDDVQQCPLYLSAKFHPVLTTSIRIICCQSSSISLTT